MTWFGGIVVFVLIWWLIFIAALPWGVRHSATPEEGHDPGAPVNPRLWTKAFAATVIAAALTAAVWGIIASDWITFRN